MKNKILPAIQSKLDALYERALTTVEDFYMAINDMLIEGARVSRSRNSSSKKRSK